MLTKFSLYNESEMNKWDAFVESHPQGNPFHLSAWLTILHETYNFEPFLYVINNEDGDLSGISPYFKVRSFFGSSRMVSLPFSDYGGPIFNNKNQEREVMSEIINRFKCIEIRSSLTDGSNFVRHNYYKRHLIDLSQGFSAVKKNIDSRTILYSIRKAEKAGVVIREENTSVGLKEFYRLNLLTRKKHGVPSQPFIFFEKLYDHMISRGLAIILLAMFDSRTIAAGLFLKYKDVVYYKYNVSDPKYLSKTTPNHLLMWYAIEKALKEGYRYFDLGRSSPDNEGLMRYKKMWGAETEDLPYYYFPIVRGAASRKEKSFAYRMVTGIWSRLSDSLSEKVGPKIYRYLG